MPHFKIKDLLLAVSLIGVGLSTLKAWHNADWWWLTLWSLPLVCAGVFTLFNRPWHGLVVGWLLYPVITVLGVVALFLLWLAIGHPSA